MTTPLPSKDVLVPLEFSHNSRFVDWDHLRVFYYVATVGSLTKAAEYLNTFQPSLSRVIQNLERRLGEKLFIRGGRQLVLTRAGELAYEAASQAFVHIAPLRHKIEEEWDKPTGDIRLRAANGFLTFYLLKYIPGFLKKYPDIRLSISSGKMIPALDLLEMDVIIRPSLPDRKDLIQIPLLTNHVKLYASGDYLAKFGTLQNPVDLDHHRLIAFGNPPGSYGFHGMNWHLTLGLTEGQKRKAFIEVDFPEDRLQLAAAGLGIATISAEHPHLENYNLVEVLGHIQGPTVQSCYIYSKNLQNSKRLQLLRDYLVNCFTKDYGA